MQTYVIQLAATEELREAFISFEAEDDIQAIALAESLVPADRPKELWQQDRLVWTSSTH